MKIEFTLFPVATDIDFLTSQINQESVGFGRATTFAFFVRNQFNSIIAGANGSVIFGAIYTDQLWVDKNHRKSGWGTKLMDV
jgi:hypothetical protein